jgi:hypothetical protein
MKRIGLLIIAMVLSVSSIFAQDEKELSLSVGLHQDAFFGFYPVVSGSYGLSEKMDFTFYGIMWGGGLLDAIVGQWTEFGVGANFKAGNLDINPQLGLLSGTLLSGSGTGSLIDGIVPNLTVGYDDKLFEGEFYGGLYTAINNTVPGTSTNNYLHYWVSGGVKLLPFMSLGVHFEDLTNTGGVNHENVSRDAANVYRWVGPYVQFSDPGGKGAIRFSGGGDIGDGASDFYKLSFTLNF